jgi:hypothetical protein
MINKHSPVLIDARDSYKKYADRMSDTTIRLDSAVRDKLRSLADEDHVTLGDLLARLAEREQYQREMRRANEVMERMQREDPQAWQDYLSELGGFERGTARDGLSDATTEWPEYNDGGDEEGTQGALSGR